MEKISEMIKRMCPEGVVNIKLEDVVNILDSQRKPVSKDSRIAGVYPYYGANGIQDYVDDYIFDGTYILLGEDGSVINEDKSPILHWVSGKIWVNNHAHILENKGNANLRYIYYALTETDVSDIVRGTPPKLNQANLRSIVIPLPPLPIQKEIVRILDSFTSMITNLETELASRQKQYEYYRNKLLTFDENDESVEWKTLGDIGTMYKGKGIQKADFVDEGMPCIHYGQVHTYYGFTATETKSFISEGMYSNSNKAKKGDLIIATTSEDVEACCKSTVWLGDTEPAISGDAHYFRHNQNPKYIGYLFMTEMFAAQKRTAAVGAKVTRVHGDSILKFKFPIPSIQHQNEVVEKLDNFEVLISNIKQEIAARKKQYEYYREKLLTFE